MKNVMLEGAMKTLAIIAMVAVVGFTMMACEDKLDPQTEVKVTGIPATYAGQLGVVCFIDGNGKLVGQGSGNVTSSGTVTAGLILSGDPVELKVAYYSVYFYISTDIADWNVQAKKTSGDEYNYAGSINNKGVKAAEVEVIELSYEEFSKDTNKTRS